VLSYEEAFAKIEEATGVKEVDKIVENFIMAEDRNFKMFKFVN
jgi:coiled-coil domain-containing protein 63/114